MILDTRTTDVIRVVMGGAPSTTQPDFFTSWLELNDGDPSVVFLPGESNGVLDGVTPVTLIPGPTADGNRVQAKFIAVFNKDTADVSLTFDFFDGTSSRTILKVVLEPDWSVIWEPGGTWHVYDNNGLMVLGAAVPREFTKAGVFLDEAAARDVTVWRAPFACTVTNVRGYRVGGTGATINARLNGVSEHLSSDLSLTSAATWQDGGAVQNTAYAVGDKLELRLKSVTGPPTEVTIQVDFTRP